MNNSANNSSLPIDTASQTILAKKFSLRHSFRAGAIVWTKDRQTNKDYYLVFKSYTRPARGTQLPGGRVEKLENIADTVVREVKEETGLDTRILCPLGFIYLNNPGKDYSRVEIYYIVRPNLPLDIHKKWQHIDRDKSAQHLECWFVPVDRMPQFLAPGQDQAVDMFRQWLKEHAKEKGQLAQDYSISLNSPSPRNYYSGQYNTSRTNSGLQGGKSNYYRNLDKQVNQFIDYKKTPAGVYKKRGYNNPNKSA